MSGQILDYVAAGEITPSEGQSLMAMTETLGRNIDGREFEERLDNLEKKLGKD